MLLKILIIIIMVLLAVIGFALIYGGQYLFKEKYIKSGLREGFHNTTVNDYPENKNAKKLLVAGQICIGIDIIIAILFFM